MRLFSMLFSMIATTLMGIGLVVVLSLGMDTWKPIVIAAAIGFVVAIPFTWWVSKAILNLQKSTNQG